MILFDEEGPVAFTLSNVKPTVVNEAALLEKDGFDYSLIWMPALGLCVLAGLIRLGFYLYRRQQLKHKSNDPVVLFHELCHAYSLSWSQRRALLKLAEIRKTANPCLVIFDAALWPDFNDPLVSRSLANKLSELHRMLFKPIAPVEAKPS